MSDAEAPQEEALEVAALGLRKNPVSFGVAGNDQTRGVPGDDCCGRIPTPPEESDLPHGRTRATQMDEVLSPPPGANDADVSIENKFRPRD